jgi:hypothetical protein
MGMTKRDFMRGVEIERLHGPGFSTMTAHAPHGWRFQCNDLHEVALGSHNDGAQPDWDDYLSRIAIGKCEDAECEYCAENKPEPR